MTRVSMADNGKMAAVFAPIAEVERLLKTVDGYVVLANVNSNTQSVIGGGTKAVEQAEQMFLAAGFNVVELPVSHAFHTSIVAPASEPLKQMLQRLRLQTPVTPIISNVTGEFYSTGPEVGAQIPDILATGDKYGRETIRKVTVVAYAVSLNVTEHGLLPKGHELLGCCA